jgi:hypothetical protein
MVLICAIHTVMHSYFIACFRCSEKDALFQVKTTCRHQHIIACVATNAALQVSPPTQHCQRQIKATCTSSGQGGGRLMDQSEPFPAVLLCHCLSVSPILAVVRNCTRVAFNARAAGAVFPLLPPCPCPLHRVVGGLRSVCLPFLVGLGC